MIVYGAVFDWTHSYTAALYLAVAALLISALLFLTLPRFTPAAQSNSKDEAHR